MTAEDNFKALCDLTTNIMGLPKGSLAYKSRKLELQIPRAAASVVATMENIHCTVIAKGIKRDRSLIYHYNKMHSSNYSSWKKYRTTFNQIYMAHTQVENAKKDQAIIRIKCDKIGTDVNVSFREFYDTLELCKLALQDYKYQIEIK